MSRKNIRSFSVRSPFGASKMELASLGGGDWEFTARIPGVFGVTTRTIRNTQSVYSWESAVPGPLGVERTGGESRELPRELIRDLPNSVGQALRDAHAGRPFSTTGAVAAVAVPRDRKPNSERAVGRQANAPTAAVRQTSTVFSRRPDAKDDRTALIRFARVSEVLWASYTAVMLRLVPSPFIGVVALKIFSVAALLAVVVYVRRRLFRVVPGAESQVMEDFYTVKQARAALPAGPVKDQAKELEDGMWAVIAEAASARKGFTDSQRAACSAAATAATGLRSAKIYQPEADQTDAATRNLLDRAERAGIVAGVLRDPDLEQQ